MYFFFLVFIEGKMTENLTSKLKTGLKEESSPLLFVLAFFVIGLTVLFITYPDRIF